MNQIEAMNWRYATKKFDSTQHISQEQLETLLEVLRLSPSSFGLQPWKFIVISKKELQQQLLPYSFHQTQVVDCSHLIVMAAKNSMDAEYIQSYLQDTVSTRGVEEETLEGYKNMLLGFVERMNDDAIRAWGDKQVYIALGNLMTAAANMRIDSCPMEGFDKVEYDNILGLEEQGYHSVVLCPVGFRAEDDKYAHAKKVRFSKVKVVEIIE